MPAGEPQLGPIAAADDAAGVEANRRLTSSAGVLLLVLVAIEGITLLSLRSMLPLHIFVGVVLVPPVLLKLASTGYRLLRYYRGSAPYVRSGPPALALRLLAPLVVLSTGALLATGIALLVLGPGGGTVKGLHQLSFIVFSGALGLHVLGHVRSLPALAAADWRRGARLTGTGSRRLVLIASLVAGVAIGAVAIAYDGAWVHRGGNDDRAALSP
jgi:hypothetical protein